MVLGRDRYIKGVSVVIGPLLPAYIDAEAYFKYHKKIFGFDYIKCFAVVSKQVYTSYFSQVEFEAINRTIKKQGLSQIKKNITLFYNGLDRIEKWSKDNEKKSPKELSDQELLKVFLSFIDVSEPVAPSIPYMRFSEKILCTKLASKIKEDGVIEKLATPDDVESVIMQERRHLVEIAYDIKIRKASREEKIREHLNKFEWSTTHFSMDKPLNVTDVKTALEPLLKDEPETLRKKLEELNNNLENTKKEKKNLLARTKLSATQKEMISILEHFARIKILLQDRQSYSTYIFLRFLYEIARRINLSEENIKWLLPKEIELVVKKNTEAGSLLEKIESRKELYALSVMKNNFKVLEGKEAAEFAKKVEEERINLNEVRGKVGFRGRATGKAVVVKSRKDFEKVKPGDILVTTTTTPQFIPIIKLVKAIVTDSGGITSHAAIVSREMKIPCVLGTKIATDVFNDGDVIEVDAIRGVVRKVK